MTKVKLTALAITATIFATSAMADTTQNIKECEAHADAVATASTTNNQQGRAISGVTGFIGALVGTGNPQYAAGSAIRGYGHGVASDMRMAESQRRMAFDRCMRERTKR